MIFQKQLGPLSPQLPFLLTAAILLFTCPVRAQKAPEPEVYKPVTLNSAFPNSPVFKPGEGYRFFRIPSLITTSKGSVLAFCEGRSMPYDSGRVDIVMKKSVDGGSTWTKVARVAGDGTNTWGNPCAVIDKSNGRIWMFMCHNLGGDTNKTIDAGTSKGTRTIWNCYSDDDGDTWSAPENITATTKSSDWRWCATGPGIGIQLKSGRLVIPCNFTDPVMKTNGNYLIYSDDHGKSWARGRTVYPNMNESQVVELDSGRLMFNSRCIGEIPDNNGKKNQYHNRFFAWSSDQGITWTPPALQTNLQDPRCQGSTIGYPFSNILFFSNPQGKGREDLMIQASKDEGKSWVKKVKLCEGPAGYSCLSLINSRTIGCLYEAGFINHSSESIAFAQIPLSTVLP